MLVVAVLSVVLAAGPLVAHADLRERLTASRIAPEVRGVDVVEPQFLKPIAHDPSADLGGLALLPVVHADPVAKLRIGVT